jgi:twitching motility protein PilT
MNYPSTLEDLLETAGKYGASDVHISVGRYPTLRIDDRLVPLTKYQVLSAEDTEKLAEALINKEQKDQLLLKKEIDFSYNFKNKFRLRANVFFQKGSISVALRIFPTRIKTTEELGLPPILESFTNYAQGFFLVTGPSGHGKTTTLAALLDLINHTQTQHIITIEDPIEYIFEQDKCIIDQREVGFDTLSFRRALRSALREDPDIIMVGEMRDLETISTALTAAETGHLVFASLHTNSAAQTIDRIIDSFPPGAKNQIRTQLASTLIGISSQRLIPRINGGRIPAVEVMIANYAIRNLIREDKVFQIDLVIETSTDEKMISLNRSLADLVRRGEVSMEDAEIYSLNRADLKMLMKK